MLSDDLVEQNQAVVRRAISTAYYAVFHRLCELCADALVGKGRSPFAYPLIYRALDHGPAKKVANHAKLLDKDLFWTLNQFQELQDARLWADYDPSPGRKTEKGRRFPQEKARELVEFARSAISALNALSAEQQVRLAALLIGKLRVKQAD